MTTSLRLKERDNSALYPSCESLTSSSAVLVSVGTPSEPTDPVTSIPPARLGHAPAPDDADAGRQIFDRRSPRFNTYFYRGTRDVVCWCLRSLKRSIVISDVFARRRAIAARVRCAGWPGSHPVQMDVHEVTACKDPQSGEIEPRVVGDHCY